MVSASPLSPTFYGHIASTQDALLLFEACLSGAMNHVARRPHDRERAGLIQSGNVFIYEEHSSGIKRWTDGVPWSPSRILGNFLVYRELERPFPPGEKKRAMKRGKKSPGISKAQVPFTSSGIGHNTGNGYTPAPSATSYLDSSTSNSLSKETERSLIGSLVDSYGFKDEGLVKKTVSVTVGGVSHHLVSYYSVADVMNNRLQTPSKDPTFQHIIPRPDLVTKQNFRTSIDEVDTMDRMDDRTVYSVYPYARNGYEMTNQCVLQRPISLPTPPVPYAAASVYSNYTMSANPAPYDGIPTSTSNSTYDNQFAPSPGIYLAPKNENVDYGGYRQQRYTTMIGTSSDTNRNQIPAISTNFPRRSSNFDHGSVDSGVSVNSCASADSKLSNDSGYSSQGYYGSRENAANTTNIYALPKSLPIAPQHAAYNRPAHIFSGIDNAGYKENIGPMGNSSAGHGHYTASQQWASTGAS
ncbi:Global transcription regulator [Lachnellula occidentalis]|uniref:Global transcription regulator n=1 Tax=Lachnellula occidentalis TaxID=215460 RepID=A0A8H8SA41_9HELO|nr:Global transcription regulator [Lachnellula occidentalis]